MSAEYLIDEIDMAVVQTLITAVNESNLTYKEKKKIRKILDRWQNALGLVDKIKVIF